MLTAFDKALLNILQTGLPIASRPYQEMAERLGCDEETVILALSRLKTQGYIRRMGAFFDSAELGYVSTLAAVKVLPEQLQETAVAINALPGVTHNYEREGEYNLWFAITCPSQFELEKALTHVKGLAGVEKLMSLPATKKFKVSVEFNLT